MINLKYKRYIFHEVLGVFEVSELRVMTNYYGYIVVYGGWQHRKFTIKVLSKIVSVDWIVFNCRKFDSLRAIYNSYKTSAFLQFVFEVFVRSE